METVKDVADSMLANNKVSQDEYNLIKEAGVFEMPKEEFVEKLAAKGSFFKEISEKFIFPAAAAATVGLIGKEVVVDPLMKRSKLNKSFEQMQEKVPQLKDKNDKDLKDYFNVVKTFSPKAASNPLVAGALVNKMMEFGGVDHKLVQDLASIESGLARPSTLQTATEAAAKQITKVPGGTAD